MQPAGRFTVPDSHPSLPGHFPGHPVVPAVVLLAEVADLLLAAHPGRRLSGLQAAKFAVPVLPGQTVEVECGAGTGAAPGERLAFACTVAGQRVLHGTALLGLPLDGPGERI